ncbi:MAG: hypothetical protein Q8R02_24000 [Hyphomonadaceae bacterium]|nr:hypothetical protein [Hyphomonadaceae bacterium]
MILRVSGFKDLTSRIGTADVVSTDVFDTLLLRTNRSERSRIVMGEHLFADALAKRRLNAPADMLIDARLQSQRLAFRALNSGGAGGEVRFCNVVARQLRICGLPDSLVSERLEIELRVEKASLGANERLAKVLRAHREAGARIIAVSDTTLPATAVRALIEHFHGTDLVDEVYSSADHGMTKRDGDLFMATAKAESVSLDRILHIGDDLHADVKAALAKGMSAIHIPRSRLRHHLRSADGAVAEARRVLRHRERAAIVAKTSYDDAASFGREVLGPIVTQFCQLIWLYAAQAEATHRPVLLFCARGGVGIREAFERVLAKLDLPLEARRENIMISRLVAARSALLAKSTAAIEELTREFRGSDFAEVARALGGSTYDLPDAWREPFRSDGFLALLFGQSGGDVLADIRSQNALFARHFDKLTGGSDRVILCDTGLYGSTQRLLASGFPDRRIETIQFARSNYKGHSEEHFPKVAGLLVERNRYSPISIQSSVLRYWHLIESLFEPAVQSVRLFSEDANGEVAGNCGNITCGALDHSVGNPLLSGVLSYINALPAGGAVVANLDAERAWRRLKRAITQPAARELACLGVGVRSVDFGRTETVSIVKQAKDRRLTARLMSMKAQLWREGAIAREFPVLKHALLPVLGSVQSLRGIMECFRR